MDTCEALLAHVDVDNHTHDKDEFIDLVHFYALIDIYHEAMKALSE